MKILLKIAAIAAALSFASAAVAQAPAAAPVDAVSAASQAAPAQPQQVAPAGAAAATPAPVAAAIAPTRPTPGIGQPDGGLGFQRQVTPIGERAVWFHDALLMPVITIISLFVLGLMLWVIARYRRAAHPTPSRTTHNTVLEVVWTLVPVLILVAIVLPSYGLLRAQYSPPRADITVKAIGNQWYWTYQYPDHGDFEIVSNMLSDADARTRGEPRLLGVDERMVVPAGATVKVIVTASDVIHSWGVPSFWAKVDAVPGRLNETWFKVDRPGVYYGQCFELCGARHAYMPIAVEVMPPAQFAAWVASKGGTMPGSARPTSPDATVNSPITGPAATPGAEADPTEATPPPTLTPGTATPPVSSQGAETSRGN